MRLSLAAALIGAATTVSVAVNVGTLNGYLMRLGEKVGELS
jgi:hypothetical protein